MRFLFVLDRHAKPIEALLSELSVTDVEVVRVGKSERAAPSVVLERAQTAMDVGICEIDRNYRKSLGGLPFGFMSKAFRADDLQLRAWLSPPPPAVVATVATPRVSFEIAAANEPRLVLADTALDRADELANHRWAFASKAAQVLADHAAGKDLGPMRDWTTAHGVAFATNGKVAHSYRPPGDHNPIRTEWHLKEGDKTTPEGAARIYFDTRRVNGILHTIVFYVGPHPSDATYHPSLDSAAWVKP